MPKSRKEAILFATFLESTPPSLHFSEIEDLTEPNSGRTVSGMLHYDLLTPEIQLHCPGEACEGKRFFRCTNAAKTSIQAGELSHIHISYTCSNCRKNEKVFSLSVLRSEDSDAGYCQKLGESPPYGSPISSRTITIIGPDRDLFLNGYRCENQGFGIGSFAYYRRVVENQKNRILDEITKVAHKLKESESVLKTLHAAKNETQFSKALASVKDILPDVLLVNGENPLTTLHAALSEGIHEQTDEQCLEIASSVRTALEALSERLTRALKDEAGLKTALVRLKSAKRGR